LIAVLRWLASQLALTGWLAVLAVLAVLAGWL
jgi:hypothetical protein